MGHVVTRWLAPALLAGATIVGTAVDRVPPRDTIVLGGYRVIAADFHVHSSTWSDATVTPFGLVLEAQRQGLDALALTGHYQTLDAKWARWFSERIGGPTVLVGAEIPEKLHHLVAVGIEQAPDGRLPLVEQIADVHRQGGIAIAAHPGSSRGSGDGRAAPRSGRPTSTVRAGSVCAAPLSSRATTARRRSSTRFARSAQLYTDGTDRRTAMKR